MKSDIDKASAATALFRGHWFDMGTTRRNLMYLAGILAGCEPLIKQMAAEGRNVPGWDKRDHPIEMLFDDHCTAEISRLLVEVAVTVRLLDDMAGKHVVDVEFPVGELNEGKGARPLSVREACNRIIHATTVEMDRGGGITEFVNKNGEVVRECIVYVKPTTLELRGKRSGKKWHAEIGIFDFIKAATIITYRYDQALDELYDHADWKADEG